MLNGDAHATSAADSPQAIVALLPHDRDLFVIRADGDVVRKDCATLETRSRARQCGSIRARSAAAVGGAVCDCCSQRRTDRFAASVRKIRSSRSTSARIAASWRWRRRTA
jgi:hypothetical protein